MSNRVGYTLTILMFAMTCFANPASRFAKQTLQADGTMLIMYLMGDEKFHFWCTEDGIPLIEGSDNCYYYAAVDNGKLVNGLVLAHNFAQRNLAEEEYVDTNIRKTHSVFVDVASGYGAPSICHHNAGEGKTSLMASYKGQKKALVILVAFDDIGFSIPNTDAFYYLKFNQKGYSLDNHVGSVHDYFYDQSYSKLDLSFDVVGPVKVKNKHGYYGQNIDENTNDRYVGTMITEACRLADSAVNFTDYDWDNDGTVEMVYVVYAGYGESGGADASTIWPHHSRLSSRVKIGDGEGALNLDGMKIDSYACSSELSGYSGNKIDGIGTVCHEFSHCLGLPDLYDTDYSGAFGMNRWDVMDMGSYSGPDRRGEVPCGYSAFERESLGWLELTEIKEDEEYEIHPLGAVAQAYVLKNKGNENEFFVFENRQSDKWFSYLGSYTGFHGMMVSHVDYDEKTWTSNKVNTSPKHMRESIIPADKIYGTYNASSKNYNVTESDLRGDLFPGSDKMTRLSGVSHNGVGGMLFNKNADGSYEMDIVIDNIYEDNGIVHFSAGNKLACPSPYLIKDNNVQVLKWNMIANADSYIVKIAKRTPMQPGLYQMDTVEIFGTQFLLDELESGIYRINLRAKNAYVNSEWSEYIDVETTHTDIQRIESEKVSRSEVYDINGYKTSYESGGFRIVRNGESSVKEYFKP